MHHSCKDSCTPVRRQKRIPRKESILFKQRLCNWNRKNGQVQCTCTSKTNSRNRTYKCEDSLPFMISSFPCAHVWVHTVCVCILCVCVLRVCAACVCYVCVCAACGCAMCARACVCGCVYRGRGLLALISLTHQSFPFQFSCLFLIDVKFYWGFSVSDQPQVPTSQETKG